MSRSLFAPALSAFVCANLLPWVALATPLVLPVQGTLRSAAGGPVADGDYPMGLSLYAGAEGGVALYSEKLLGITVQGGVFAVDLGGIGADLPLDDALFLAADGSALDLWFGVQVGKEAELPRVALRPTAFAVHSRRASVAAGLQCSACVTTDAIVEAAIDASRLAVNAVESKHVAFTYAASDSKAGVANNAKQADFATQADQAKLAEQAISATSADEATTAGTASKLQCTGCVAAAMLAPDATADLVAAGKLAAVAVSGAYGDLSGGPDLSGYGALAAGNTWEKTQILNGGANFQSQEAKLFRFENAEGEPTPCTPQGRGLAYYDTVDNALKVCNGKDFVTFAQTVPLGTDGNPGASCQAILSAGSAKGDGVYWLKPKAVAFPAWCDMTTDGGGWTLLLNLDTSDGHVMWWAEPLWTNAEPFGDVSQPFVGDHKSQAWMDLAGGTEVMLAVHEQGVVRGWKSFKKADDKTMSETFAGGDNTPLGTAVVKADTSGTWDQERLVRLSTAIYANHCVATGGVGCTSPVATSSPDGDRIGSQAGTPSDNDGGGLGNWHDMAYCCSGKTYAGKACNGSAFRMTSEAQGGWSGQAGTFGTDSFGAMTATQSNTNCQNANWAKANGHAYDYRLLVR